MNFIANNKKFLRHSNIEIHGIKKEDISVIEVKFIWTLKISIYKNMVNIGKNVFVKKIDHIAANFSNVCHNIKKKKNQNKSRVIFISRRCKLVLIFS